MKKLAPIFNAAYPPSIYRFRSRAKPASILTAVQNHGWHGFYVDGQQITDKSSFIHQFANTLSFPDYHGSNWDAFEDCITDMAWLPATGYVILYDYVRYFASANGNDWQMAKSILSDAISYWQSKRRPMYVLLRQSWWTNWDIEKI